MHDIDPDNVLNSAKSVLEIEARAIRALIDRVGPEFAAACRLCINCRGRIVVTGLGKSGHIAGKLAATLASTGSPAFFVHSGEASHGDLGMITGTDVVLAVSNSGETGELATILPLLKRLSVPLITMTGRADSTLARAADVNLDVSVEQEACPLNLAPTASTTAALALGDALAIALLESRGFTEDDFARSHPGGTLGRRLLIHVKDIMRTGDEVPRVAGGVPLGEALIEMSRKGLGMTAIVSADNKLLGVFTDGDLRRSLDTHANFHATPVAEIMTTPCKTIGPDVLAAEAVRMLETYRINALPVVREDQQLIGALNVHDLLRAGVM